MEPTEPSTTPTPDANSYKPKSHTPEGKTFDVNLETAPRVAGGFCSEHRPIPEGEDHGFTSMVCPNCHRGYLLRLT